MSILSWIQPGIYSRLNVVGGLVKHLACAAILLFM